jgi:hypothetical protein
MGGGTIMLSRKQKQAEEEEGSNGGVHPFFSYIDTTRSE